MFIVDLVDSKMCTPVAVPNTKFGKSGEGSVSPCTAIMVCLHCHSAPAVLPLLLRGRYKKILQLCVRETQQECEGGKIHFREKQELQ